jgi:hypothetical protein
VTTRICAGSTIVVQPPPGGRRRSPRGYDIRIQVRKVNSGVCEFDRVMTVQTVSIDDRIPAQMFEVFSREITVVFCCAVNVALITLRIYGYSASVPVRRLRSRGLVRLQLCERLRPRPAVTAYFRARFCGRIKRSRSRFRVIRCVENDIDSPIHMLIA